MNTYGCFHIGAKITNPGSDVQFSQVRFGAGISNIKSTTGFSHEITTDVDHGLNRITKLSIGVGNSGAGYGDGSGGDYYNVKLVSIGASVTGKNATAKVTVDPTGGVTAVKIMDGGSAYGIGNTLAVVGIATTTGHVPAVVEVENIYNNIGDVIRVSGIKSESNSAYNQLYRIDSVGFGSATSVNVSSASTIPNFSTTGIIPDITEKAYLYLTGGEVRVSSITYDNIAGIATVVTADIKGSGTNKTLTPYDTAGVGQELGGYYGSAMNFEGTGDDDYFDTGYSIDGTFGSGDYTIECWIHSLDDQDERGIFGMFGSQYGIAMRQFGSYGAGGNQTLQAFFGQSSFESGTPSLDRKSVV